MTPRFLIALVLSTIILAACGGDIPDRLDVQTTPVAVGSAHGTPRDLSIRIDWAELGEGTGDVYGDGEIQVLMFVARANSDSRKLIAPGRYAYPAGGRKRLELSDFSLTVNHLDVDESLIVGIIVLDIDDPAELQAREAAFAIDAMLFAVSEALAIGIEVLGTNPWTFILSHVPEVAIEWWKQSDTVAAYWIELTPDNGWYEGNTLQASDVEAGATVQFSVYRPGSVYGAGEEDVEPGSMELVVLPNTLRMRSGPGTNNDTLARLAAGTRVVVLESLPNSKWVRVQVASSGRIGWVHGDYLGPIAQPVSSSTAVLSGAAASVPVPQVQLQVPAPVTPTLSNRQQTLDVAWTSVPAGSFIMGTGMDELQVAVDECNRWEGGCQTTWFDSEYPKRSVWLPTFEIMRFEVTNAEYDACVSAGVCEQAGRKIADNNIVFSAEFLMADRPVVGVSVQDASRFCAWLDARVPTEEEWEKAARGTDARLYPWGSSAGSLPANLGSSGPTAVGSFPGGISPYGAYDMAGNAFEWTSTNVGGKYVLRGGSWYTYPFRGRTADRGTKLVPNFANYDIGFRCVR